MQQKKRAHDDDESLVASKKRIISSGSTPPHSNGVGLTHAEPIEGDDLELFRKEAIYRRMRHYAREHQRCQARVAALEVRKNTCEAGMAAISACWTQLIETIRSLVKPDDVPSVDVSASRVLQLAAQVSTLDSPDVSSLLGDSMAATKDLVAQLAHRDSNLKLGSEGGWQDERISLQAELKLMETRLKAEVELLQSKLRDMESCNAELHSNLIAAETLADRARSSTVRAIEKRLASSEVKTEGSDGSQTARPPSPSSENVQKANGEISDADASLLHIVEVRGYRYARAAKEVEDQKNLIGKLELEAHQPSETIVKEHPICKALNEKVARLISELSYARQNNTKLAEDLARLRKNVDQGEETIDTPLLNEIKELKGIIAKRDAENARIREARDQYQAELTERRHKDSIRAASTQELKTLAESRSTRIDALQSELRRYKAQLAAQAGQTDFMGFLLQNDDDATTYIEDLRRRLTAAESRASAVEKSLVYFQENPEAVKIIRADAEAHLKLAEITAQLEKYQAVYGDSSSLTPDVRKLTEQLQRKEAEILRLRTLESHRQESEAPLYTEIEKLSTAWEVLDRQVTSKIFDLTTLEERATKNALDRAKWENKFYAAMRSKEALESEKKALVRNLEKQNSLAERSIQSEQAMRKANESHRLECETKNKELEAIKAKVAIIEMEAGELKARCENEHLRLEECLKSKAQLEANVTQRVSSLHSAEEAAWKSQKEFERLKNKLAKSASASSVPSSQKEEILEDELAGLTRLVQCQVCKVAIRDTVITKCMHTFCKECIDKRISSRQRKCPACGLGFGHQDVQTMYFQG